jgi:hypothetical protein
MLNKPRQAESPPEIELTSEMLEAGEAILAGIEIQSVAEPWEIATLVFRAMVGVSHQVHLNQGLP